MSNPNVRRSPPPPPTVNPKHLARGFRRFHEGLYAWIAEFIESCPLSVAALLPLLRIVEVADDANPGFWSRAWDNPENQVLIAGCVSLPDLRRAATFFLSRGMLEFPMEEAWAKIRGAIREVEEHAGEQIPHDLFDGNQVPSVSVVLNPRDDACFLFYHILLVVAHEWQLERPNGRNEHLVPHVRSPPNPQARGMLRLLPSVGAIKPRTDLTTTAELLVDVELLEE